MPAKRSRTSAASAISTWPASSESLRAYDDALPPGEPKIGVYGLDLYSLHASIEAVPRYLEKIDARAADRIAAR